MSIWTTARCSASRTASATTARPAVRRQRPRHPRLGHDRRRGRGQLAPEGRRAGCRARRREGARRRRQRLHRRRHRGHRLGGVNGAVYRIEAINLSLSGSGCSNGSDVTSLAVNRATAAGIVVAVAAGNAGPGTCSISTPGAAADAITVGAMADLGETARAGGDSDVFPPAGLGIGVVPKLGNHRTETRTPSPPRGPRAVRRCRRGDRGVGVRRVGGAAGRGVRRRPADPADFAEWLDRCASGWPPDAGAGRSRGTPRRSGSRARSPHCSGSSCAGRRQTGEWAWKAVAVGDSCLVRVRGGEVIESRSR